MYPQRPYLQSEKCTYICRKRHSVWNQNHLGALKIYCHLPEILTSEEWPGHSRFKSPPGDFNGHLVHCVKTTLSEPLGIRHTCGHILGLRFTHLCLQTHNLYRPQGTKQISSDLYPSKNTTETKNYQGNLYSTVVRIKYNKQHR